MTNARGIMQDGDMASAQCSHMPLIPRAGVGGAPLLAAKKKRTAWDRFVAEGYAPSWYYTAEWNRRIEELFHKDPNFKDGRLWTQKQLELQAQLQDQISASRREGSRDIEPGPGPMGRKQKAPAGLCRAEAHNAGSGARGLSRTQQPNGTAK